MPYIFLVMFSMLLPAFAGFEGIIIKNLDLDYARPHGSGQVHKVSLNLSSFMQGPMPINVHRTDEALVVVTPFVDLIWKNPLPLLHNAENVQTSGLNVQMGFLEHVIEASFLKATPKGQGEFKFENLSLICKGSSSERLFSNRLKDDCRESMVIKSKKVEIPEDFLLTDILQGLLPITDQIDFPADDLLVDVKNGHFTSVFYFRLFLYAGLRAYGHVSYEDNRETVVLRVDQIRWGYLPVTKIIMKELMKRNKYSNVTIEPPFIRIRIPQ